MKTNVIIFFYYGSIIIINDSDSDVWLFYCYKICEIKCNVNYIRIR